MAAAGLSFADPFVNKMHLGEMPDPFVPFNPTSGIGMDGLAPSLADMALVGDTLSKQSQFTMPAMKHPPAIAFSPSKNELYVQGRTFAADDADTALRSEALLTGPSPGLPVGGDWVPLDAGAYQQYLESIRNPTLSHLAAKNFGRGIDVSQMLFGRGLQLAGAEKTGAGIVAQQEEDLRRSSPFERMATDVRSADDAIEWFVANFAQQGPNMVESIAAAGIGFLGGMAAGGPLGAVGGTFAGLLGKQAFKEAVKAAAAKKAAGTALNTAETKLLREAAGIAGAVATSYAQNYATGAADIYGELREQGADADDVHARLTALAGAVPYAALESLPEFLLAGRVFSGAMSPTAMAAGTPLRARAGTLLTRGAVGGLVGGIAEGTTELGQESLLLGLSGQDMGSPENVNRLINSFAAGFGVGGPIGAVANLKGKAPANLLDPAGTTGPTPGTTGVAPAPAPAPLAPIPSAAQIPLNLQGGAAAPAPTSYMGNIYGAAGPMAIPSGTQGVLDVGVPGQPMTPQEAAYRGQPQPTGYPIALQHMQPQLELFPEQAPIPRQGALQFGAPAPTGLQFTDAPYGPPTAMGTALQQAQMEFAQQQRAQQLAQQKLAQQQADAAKLANIAAAQRQVAFAQQQPFQHPQPPLAPGQLPPFTPPMPMRQTGPTQPVQLPLFTRRQAPVPSRAEGLRRGVGTQLPVAPTAPVPLTAAQRRAQAPLFTQEGKPSVAALKAAGKKSQIVPKLEIGATQIPPTGKPVTVHTVAAAKAGVAKKAVETKAAIAKLAKKPVEPKAVETNQGLKRGAKQEVKPAAGSVDFLIANIKRSNGAIGTQGVTESQVFDILTNVAGMKNIDKSMTMRGMVDAFKADPQAQQRLRDFTAQNPIVVSALPDGSFYVHDGHHRAFLLDQAGDTTIRTAYKGEETSAVQKPSATSVDARKQTGDGKGVRVEDTGKRKTAAKGEELKTKVTPEKQKPAVQNVKNVLVAKGELARAGREWAEYADPETQPTWKDLTDTQQEAWRKAVIDDKRPSMAVAEEIAPPKKETPAPKGVAAPAAEEVKQAVAEPETARADVELSARQKLEDAIYAAEIATDTKNFRVAIDTVVYHAFFDTVSNNAKMGLVQKAQDFLDNTQFGDAQQLAIDDAVLSGVNKLKQIDATFTRGSHKDEHKPWFSYVVSRNLLPSVTTKLIGLPAEYKPSPTKPATAQTQQEPSSASRITTSPEALLGELISDLIARIREYAQLDKPIVFRGETYAGLTAAAKQLYAKVSAEGRKYIVRGHPLSEYFREDGTPKIVKSAGRFIITNKEMTAAEQRKLEQEQKATLKQLAKEDKDAREEAERDRQKWEKTGFAEDDWDSDSGEFYRDDGVSLGAAIPAGRVKLLVNAFLAKLRLKPSVSVYANVADLKKRNPALYKRAAAARKEGDFDTTNAVGYSFGNNVLIFTDFVRTEQQLKYVLAHETLGHFGFRGVIPAAQLDALLNRIYDADPNVQAAVDAMVAVRGMSKLEATEEYLADNAADLDTSIILRIWNVLKNFLNKLGLKFQDDEARYIVNLARKYVRRGDTGQFVNAKTIVAGMQQIATDEVDGRYSRAADGALASAVFRTGALNKRYSQSGGLLGAMDAFAKDAFRSRKNVPGFIASIAEAVQTLDHKSRRSYGLQQIYRLLETQQQYARALLSKYQRMTVFTHTANFFGAKGVTESEKQVAGELLARAALLRAAQATDDVIKSYKDLVTIDAAGNVHINAAVRDKLEKAGFVTADEFRKGFDITYSTGEKVRFQFDVDETSAVWKVYAELRNTVNDAAIDILLANYKASQAENARVLSGLNDRRTTANRFSDDDLAAIKQAAKMYNDIRYAGSDVAGAGVDIKKLSIEESRKFLISFGRALFNDDVYKVWVKDPSANPTILKDHKEFQDAEYDDIRAALPGLKAKIRNDADSFAVQKAVADLFMFDLQSKNSTYYAVRTILGAYVPFARRGDHQVRLVAVDGRGNTIELDENVRATLPYFHTDSRADAEEIADALDKEFGADDWTLLDAEGKEVTVQFKVEVSKTRQSPDLSEAVNFNEFVYVLNRLNINITPETRERVITTLAAQNARARHNLQRSGTEGWDKDVVRSVSEFLETTAHVAAKKLFRHRLDDVLLKSSNWLGDTNKLNQLKAAVDNAATAGERARAQRAYDEYAFMYLYMKGSAGVNTVTIDGKEMNTLGRGEDYREEAKKILRWYSEAANITDSTEDMLSGETGSVLKLFTVLMQLGGSVATAVVNLASLVTHSMPYLSYYNSKRAYGGGYGEAKTAHELFRAARDMASPQLAEASFLNDLLRDGNYGDFGLTENEAKFLLDQTEEGTLQAAQFNALVGSARGKVFSNRAQAAVKVWMSAFSYTEQFNRRVTALAAYRLERNRMRAEGVTDEAQIAYESANTARLAVNSSQGEYAMFNRPEMARGNVLQYIFMYKQFVIITVQLLRSMPRSGQVMMLGFLLLASGVKGLPFADDLLDIVDTIAQKLGLKTASVEKEIATWLDDVAPGVSPYVMRGVMDRWTGATISSRLGMGDLIPLTGAFRAGADPAREAADFAGPVFSGISGLIGMGANLAKYGAETIGLRDDTTSLVGIMRESPIAALRALSDSAVYLDSGMITNAKGQVVSREAPYHVILARALGFYPAIATAQNDIVRLSKHMADYSKAIKADYVHAYVLAKLDGDTERMQNIVDDVRQWNDAAEGTGLEIPSFNKSANRAYREASRTTVARYLKSAPKQMRPETVELLRINGLEDEVN